MQKTANTPPWNSATAIMTHISKSDKIQTPTQVRHTKGMLKEILNTRRDTVALHGAPDTSMDDELPTTSAGASGQEAPPQDHHTSTPPPADGEPPRKRSLRSRNKREHDAKTPAKK
ncbi:hypothetical protein NDU88_000106 [Pleurodeles waltl]|uniref:Uncharacterized protein n=1 Tax=Pleurodeles waltl TaxID=8319 RepID=A0AAV7SVE9_PLEWA|nr:hypothetical protein NDU88_000106 [Pleurodeles waltl]